MKIAHVLSCILLVLPSLASAQDARRDPHAQGTVEEWRGGSAQPRDAGLFRATMLRDHAAVRAEVGLPPLVWDAALAADAAGYASTLAVTRSFQHAARLPGRTVEGENLWMGTRTAYAYREMLGNWIDEGRDFRPGRFPDVSRTGSWHDVGHYTQMIWPETRAVGCAMAANAFDEYLVCRYFPAGNVVGSLALAR